MADITLSFEDGTEHKYTGVPDDATPDSVIERASKDFAGKPIKHVARSLIDKSPTLANAESLPRAQPAGFLDKAKNYVMQNVVEPLATLPITGPIAGQVRDEQARRRQDIESFNQNASVMRDEKPLTELDYTPEIAALGQARRDKSAAELAARPPLTTVEPPDYTAKDYLANPSLAVDVAKAGAKAAPGQAASKFAQGGLGIAENINDIADKVVGTGFLGGKLREASRKEREHAAGGVANLPPDAKLVAEGLGQSVTTGPATIASILAKGNPATAALSLIPFGAQVYGQEYSGQRAAGKGIGEAMGRSGLATANEVGTELAGNIVGGGIAARAPVSWGNAAARGGAAMVADQLGEHASTFLDREISRVLGDPLSNDAEYRKAQLDTLKQGLIQLGAGSAVGTVANKLTGAMMSKQDVLAAAFDQMVQEAQFNKPTGQQIAEGSVARAPEPAGTMEGDKPFAKRVIDKRESPEGLPEKHDLYFNMAGATVMPISNLVSTKTEEENQQGGDNGPKRMAAAAAGELGKRDPITVMPSETPGQFEVVDGNGTLTSVKKYGWQSMPVTVVSRERGLAMIEADHAKEAAKASGMPIQPLQQAGGMPLQPLQRGKIDGQGKSVSDERTGKRAIPGIEKYLQSNPESGINFAHGKVAGFPSFINGEADIEAEIQRHMDDFKRANLDDVVWYSTAGKIIAKYGHDNQIDMDTLARLTAKFAQSMGIRENTTAVMQALEHLRKGQPVKAGIYPNQMAIDVEKLLAAPEVTPGVPGINRKLNAFYWNLWDEVQKSLGKPEQHPEHITVDQHAGTYALKKKVNSVSPQEYAYADMVMREATKRLNAEGWGEKTLGRPLQYKELQAGLWGLHKSQGAGNEERAVRNSNLTGGEAAWNYPEYMARGTDVVQAETVPSPDVSQIYAEPNAAGEFNRRALEIVRPGGVDKLAEKVGIKAYYQSEATGGYEGTISPNLVTGMLVGKLSKKTGSPDPYHRFSHEIADAYAWSWQYIYRQNAVPWFRADPSINVAELDTKAARQQKQMAAGKEPKYLVPNYSQGFEVQFDHDLTPEEEAQFFGALREFIHPDVGYTRTSPNSITVINYRGDGREPFLMPDVEFNNRLDAVVHATKEVTHAVRFAAETRYDAHDWKADPEGRAIEDKISQAGRSDLLPWIRDRRAEADAIAAEYESQGKGLPLQALNQGAPLKEMELSDVIPDDVQEHVRNLLAVAPPIPKAALPHDVMVKATLMLRPHVEAATRNKADFDKMLGEVAKSVGGVPLTTDIKKAERSAVKLVEEYNYDTSRMMDLLRGTILVGSEKEARAAAEKIGSTSTLARPPKDRFANPTEAGYRDIMVNPVMPDGHVAEILIMTPEMFVAKRLGHQLYDHTRAPGANPGWSVKANFASKLVYGLAADAATSASKASLETGMPPWKADAAGKVRGFGSNAMADNPSGASATGTSSKSTSFQPFATSSSGVMGASSYENSLAQGGSAVLGKATSEWFGKDSNLIDEQGNPLKLYHGTNKAFSDFKASKTGVTGPGVYLGLDSDVANAYAGDGPGANVIPVIARGRYIDIMDWTKYVTDNGNDWAKARAAAEKDGVAGIIDRKFEYAVNVFDPKNIRPAVGANQQAGASFVYGPLQINDAGAGLTSQYKPKLDERDMARRGLEPLERKQITVIDAALGDIIAAGLPRAWAEKATYYGLKSGALANYHPLDAAVGVSIYHLNSAVAGEEEMKLFIRGWLAHEMHHLIDNYKGSNTEMFYLSAESPRMDVRVLPNGVFMGKGDLAKEALNLWNGVSEGSDDTVAFLSYPMLQAQAMAGRGDVEWATNFAKVELFAQLGAMYITNPELMARELPAWHAFFKEWSDARGDGSIERSRVALRGLLQKSVPERADQGRVGGEGVAARPLGQDQQRPVLTAARPGVGANAPGAGVGRGPNVLPANPQAPQGQAALGAYRDLSRAKIPGDNHIPTHVNYSTFNSAAELKKVYAGLSEKYEKEIQEQRRGTVSWKESYKDARKLFEDESGISARKIDAMLERKPGTPSGAAEILARMAILESEAAKTKAMADKIQKQGSLQTSDQEWLDFAAQLERTAMAHQTFLGARAEIGRAMNAIKGFSGLPYDGKQVQSVLDTFDGTEALGKVATAIAQATQAGGKGGRGQSHAIGRLAKAATKATVTDAVIELWKAGLLSGPTTHLANLISNTLFTAMRLPEQAVAGTVGALHGGKSAHLGETVALAFGMMHGVQQGFRAAAQILANEDATFGNTPTEEHQHAIAGATFGATGKLGDVIDYLGKAVRMPFRMLSAEDAIFKMVNMYGSLYAGALRTALDEGGGYWRSGFSQRVAELVKEGEQTMLDPAGAMGPSAVSDKGKAVGMEAIADGLTYTFQNKLGKIGQSVEMVRNNIKATHFIIPFVRTPLNIFRQGLERTPFAPMSKQWRGDVAEGGHKRDLALGKAMLGTSMMALVFAAVEAGLMTGGGDPEEARRRRRMEAGVTPYSIKINGKWVEYRRLEPLGTILGAAADAAETRAYAQEDNSEHVMSMVAAAFAQAVTSKTYMKGLADLVNVMAQPERYGERWYQSLAGSVVPAAVGQYAGRNDLENGRPVVRDVRSMGEGKTGIEDLKETTANAIKGRLPKTRFNPEFNRESLPKRVDTWGDTQTSAPGSFPGSPIRVSAPTDDPVRQEANRLGVKMTDIGTKAMGVKLNADQLERHARASGALAHSVMETLIQTPAWEGLPDFVKVRAFEEAIRSGREYGKGIITPEVINQSIEKTLKGLADVEYD